MMVYSKLLFRTVYQITQVVTLIDEIPFSEISILYQTGNGTETNNHPYYTE